MMGRSHRLPPIVCGSSRVRRGDHAAEQPAPLTPGPHPHPRTSLTRPAPRRLRPHPPLPLAPGPQLVLEETLAADQGHAGGKPSFLQEKEPRSAGGSCLRGGPRAKLSHYLGAEAGERGEDAGVDEAELRLDLVAAEVVDRLTVLVQDQVLGVGPEPKTDAHTVSTVSFWEDSHPRGGTGGGAARYWECSRG